MITFSSLILTGDGSQLGGELIARKSCLENCRNICGGMIES